MPDALVSADHRLRCEESTASGRSGPPPHRGRQRTYLSGAGATAVAVAWLSSLAILLAYFSSSTSWAPW